MSEKRITRILIGTSVGLFMIILIATVNAILTSDSVKWFHFDFETSHQIISSYSGLIGTLLSFLTTLFLIYNILKQKWDYQKEQNDKKTKDLEEFKEHADMLHSLIDDIINLIKATGQDIKKFYEAESSKPLEQHFRATFSDKIIDRIMNLDYSTNYKVFNKLIVEEGRMILFKDLYKRIDFYVDAIEEDKRVSKSHINDKTDRLNDLVIRLEQLVNESIIISEQYRKEFPTKTEEMQLINSFVDRYNRLLEGQSRISLEEIKIQLLSIFIDEIKRYGQRVSPEYMLTEYMLKLNDFCLEIEKVKVLFTDFCKRLKEQYEQFFNEENEHYKKLVEARDLIEKYI